MSNGTTSKETKPNDRELTLDELEAVAAGKGKTQGNTTPIIFLRFDFRMVDVKTIS